MSSATQTSWVDVLPAVSVIGGLVLASIVPFVGATWAIASKLSRMDKNITELGGQINVSSSKLGGQIAALTVRVESIDDRLVKIDGFVDDLRQSVPSRRNRRVNHG